MASKKIFFPMGEKNKTKQKQNPKNKPQTDFFLESCGK